MDKDNILIISEIADAFNEMVDGIISSITAFKELARVIQNMKVERSIYARGGIRNCTPYQGGGKSPDRWTSRRCRPYLWVTHGRRHRADKNFQSNSSFREGEC